MALNHGTFPSVATAAGQTLICSGPSAINVTRAVHGIAIFNEDSIIHSIDLHYLDGMSVVHKIVTNNVINPGETLKIEAPPAFPMHNGGLLFLTLDVNTIANPLDITVTYTDVIPTMDSDVFIRDISASLSTAIATVDTTLTNQITGLQSFDSQVSNLTGGWALLSTTLAISAYLQNEIASIQLSGGGTTDTQLRADVGQVTASLQSQIDDIQSFDSQIASISGTFSGLSTIANISAGLDTRITNNTNDIANIQSFDSDVANLTGSLATVSFVNTVSGNLTTEIETEISLLTPLTTTANLTGSLQSQITTNSTNINNIQTFDSQIAELTGSFITASYVNVVSGNLASDIATEASARALADTTLHVEVALVSSNLSTNYYDKSTADGLFVHLTGDEVIAGNKTLTGNINILGNANIAGTTTTLNAQTIEVADNIITLNSNVTGAPVLDSGIEVVRGNQTDARLIWSETSQTWTAGLSGSESKIWTAGNDGSGSGLDADLLDGHDSTYFATASDVTTNTNNINNIQIFDSQIATLTGSTWVKRSGDTITGTLNVSGAVTFKTDTTIHGTLIVDTPTGNIVNWGGGKFVFDATNQKIYAGDGLGKGQVVANGAFGNDRSLHFDTNYTDRWVLKADSTNETGFNTGSNLILSAYDDSGTLIDNPMSVARVSGGALTINRPVVISTNENISGGLTVNGQTTINNKLFVVDSNDPIMLQLSADRTASTGVRIDNVSPSANAASSFIFGNDVTTASILLNSSNNTSNPSTVVFSQLGSNPFSWQIASVEKMRLTNTGSLTISGSINAFGYQLSGSNLFPLINSNLATMPASTVKGNASGSSATPQDITIPNLGTLVNPYITTPFGTHAVSDKITAFTPNAISEYTKSGVTKIVSFGNAGAYSINDINGTGLWTTAANITGFGSKNIAGAFYSTTIDRFIITTSTGELWSINPNTSPWTPETAIITSSPFIISSSLVPLVGHDEFVVIVNGQTIRKYNCATTTITLSGSYQPSVSDSLAQLGYDSVNDFIYASVANVGGGVGVSQGRMYKIPRSTFNSNTFFTDITYQNPSTSSFPLQPLSIAGGYVYANAFGSTLGMQWSTSMNSSKRIFGAIGSTQSKFVVHSNGYMYGVAGTSKNILAKIDPTNYGYIAIRSLDNLSTSTTIVDIVIGLDGYIYIVDNAACIQQLSP